MDCFPDFCIGCDSQAVDGFYCSETCRMADIERSSSSIPASPVNNFAAHHSAFHFALPKALTKSSSTKTSATSTRRTIRTHSEAATTPASPRRVLSPSSSRSSLTSSGSEAVPEEALKELLNYFNAFDRTRDQRRKSVPVSKQSTTWDHAESH